MKDIITATLIIIGFTTMASLAPLYVSGKIKGFVAIISFPIIFFIIATIIHLINK